MTSDTPQDFSGLPSPDPAANSEANSSVQVNFDSTSNSTGARSPSPSLRLSPSRARETSLARQATANSLSSFLSSQPSPRPVRGDHPPHEDVLMDLIVPTSSSNDTTKKTLHGVKRPRDDETTDEPDAKRDKLGEELDLMCADNPGPASTAVASTSSTSKAPAYVSSANGPRNIGSGGSAAGLATGGALPLRIPRHRPSPRVGTTRSRGELSEASEPASSSGDETKLSTDG